MILRRTNTDTGAVMQDSGATSLTLARQRIAWCATDNLDMTKKTAAETANQFTGDTAFTLGRYVFEWITE